MTETNLPAFHGRDHAALALLPLTVASPSGGCEAVERGFSLTVDGKPRRVSVTLQPGTEGLPTHGDGMVYLALLQLAMRDEKYQRVEFTRSELLEVLAWHANGANYDRLRTALERLHALRIVVNAAMVARNGREYQRSQDAAHLIDRYHIAEQPGAVCWLEWGGLVREAFALADFKRLDWDMVKALGNPLTAQLYRLLDRVTLSGEPTWSIGWRPLAGLLGMSHEGYARPARFRQKLDPHLDRLIEQGVLASYEYGRGGVFTFHMRNYLRGQLRGVLVSLGVYDEAARQLVAGYDEVRIICQCDCLRFGNRQSPEKPAGFLVEAVRKDYPLSYDDQEAPSFAATWDLLMAGERDAYHRAGLQIVGGPDGLFDVQDEPAEWNQVLRAVVRFLVTQNLDPDEILRPAAR